MPYYCAAAVLWPPVAPVELEGDAHQVTRIAEMGEALAQPLTRGVVQALCSSHVPERREHVPDGPPAIEAWVDERELGAHDGGSLGSGRAVAALPHVGDIGDRRRWC